MANSKVEYVPTTEAECKEWGGTWTAYNDGTGGGVCTKVPNNKSQIDMAVYRGHPCHENPMIISIKLTAATRPISSTAQKKNG